MTSRGELRIGLSGWSYDGWRGKFYPDGLPRRRELEYASRAFDSLEVNGSFYSLQKPSSYRKWHDETPDDFIFALKGSRFITHNKKLGDIEAPLANFLASGLLLLGKKLGPIVWQLPERARFDADRIEGFFERLPNDTEEAAAHARKHDERMSGREWTETDARRPLRHALEVRNESFLVPGFVDLARAHGIAIAFSHSATWPYTEEVTADFVYLRLHGGESTYESRYGSELERWAERVEAWRSGREPEDAERITEGKPPRAQSRDVYVYFDNDQHAHAPLDAAELAERLGVAKNPPSLVQG